MPPDLAMSQFVSPERASAAGVVLQRTTFPATFENIRLTIRASMDSLAPLELGEEEHGAVQLVLAEALNNVAEHAFAPHESGQVTLILRHGRAGLLVEIRDCGKPMPNGRAPINDGPSSESARQDLPEGGFGWFLIRELARDLIYDRRDGENILIFRVAIGKGHTSTE
jgi:serine/threonine-protein kinase RsbW